MDLDKNDTIKSVYYITIEQRKRGFRHVWAKILISERRSRIRLYLSIIIFQECSYQTGSPKIQGMGTFK